MNSAAFALRKQTVMVVMTILLIGAGIISYQRLGRLEDPTFVIKTALIITRYPGASPAEVEEEVTDVIEEAVQSLGELKEVYSTSQEGLSIVFAEMKDEYKSYELPQIWDELRRKVNDAQGKLPPGAGPSLVNDDFGDVYGVFFALTGPGYSYAQLKDYADDLKKELLLCDNVAKIDFWGLQQEVIYVEVDRAKLAKLGLTPIQIFSTLQSQNVVAPSGKVETDGEYLRITPTGDFTSEKVIADLYIGSADSLIRLGDVASIRRGYIDPPRNIMRFNGKPAIGLGISTVDGGNVIVMGEAIKKRLAELEGNRPVGMELHTINYQSNTVQEKVNGFVLNLAEAVVIVIVLLMIFMGWQSGLLIGVVLLLTILGTFIGMYLCHIELHKISLGALILALGMLVDNAIVVADGILIRVERGESREEAAHDVVRDTQWPLLGATIVAILAFAAIGFAPGNVGEFCRHLFYVMALSLFFSWVLAVTITPLFCVWWLKIPDLSEDFDPYDRPMFRAYRNLLHLCLHFRWGTAAATLALLALAIYGFGLIPNFFFADSTRNQFYIDYWRSQGVHIEETSKDLRQIEEYVLGLDHVENVATFAGEGALRFILSYDYESPNASFGQLLLEVDDYRVIDELKPKIEAYIRRNFEDAEARVRKFVNGPAVTYGVEARFRGPDVAVLRKLGDQAKDILWKTPNIRDISDDWRHPVRVLRPHFAEAQARRTGITRNDLSSALQWTFVGSMVGLYREGDELLPIISRPPLPQRKSIENMASVQVPSRVLGRSIPLGQVVSGIDTDWEPPLIQRRYRQRCLTVQCNPLVGLTDPLFRKVRSQIEAIPLPPGYSLEWGGEYKESRDAQAPLQKAFPLCLIGMFIIIVWLFNSVRKPVIIFLVVPLAIIGVTAGLLITGLPFGFMAILGFLGLSGMLIKNAIVLMDQIDLDLKAGKPAYQAVLDSAVSRMRPVIMASGTTILGMAPLITDPFYKVMAATIMSGLLAATFLTLIVVPVLYSFFFKIKPDSKHL